MGFQITGAMRVQGERQAMVNRVIRQLVVHAVCLVGLWPGFGAWAQSTDTVTYVYTDPQGTPLAEADAQGNVIARYDYAPYGTPVASLGNPPNGPGYTGHVNDPDTGLVYMQARYYDPVVGRFISIDPVGPEAGNAFNFNRYTYVNANPIKNIDPDGRNGVEAFGGLLYESFQFIQGNGFDGSSVAGALVDGYNGQGDGPISAAFDDIGAVTAVVGGVGLARTVGQLAVRQTGARIVSQLAKNAIKDDVKGNVRQIVKSAEHLEKDVSAAMKGAKVGESSGTRGVVQTAEHSDGTRVSVRSFSGKDGTGRPTIQVNNPATKVVTKVRYEH